jgi:uncharacterized protein involved in type VI secretion and phage assembly
MEGARSRSRVATATGNVTGLVGGAAAVGWRASTATTRAMLVVAVTHSGHAPEVLTDRADGREDAVALCEYGGVYSWRRSGFRPERVTPWPRVSGVELARVEGPDPQALRRRSVTGG